MTYKMQNIVLLLNNDDEPLFVLSRKHQLGSVCTAIQAWEIVERSIDQIVQDAFETTEYSASDEQWYSQLLKNL